MIDEPRIVHTEALQTASIRLTVPREEIRDVMGPGYTELMETVGKQMIGVTGPWFTYHHRMDPEVFDFEIGVPVASPVTPDGRVAPSVLPAATVARTVYKGGYPGLPDAWEQFDAWIADNGHTLEGALWEFYVAGPESDPDPATWRTELSRPLAELPDSA